MTDIFDATILCKDCACRMEPVIINKSGVRLRAIECPECKDHIIHPSDVNAVENFKNIKGKTYSVKLRIVGNSHAISIPKEIINFIREQENIMDNMVKLCFEDMNRLSLEFGNGHPHSHSYSPHHKSHSHSLKK